MTSHPTGPARPGSGPERRRHPRIRVDLPVTISLEDGLHEARLRDVSRSGICFFLDRPIEEMTILGMRIDLPSDTPAGARRVRIEGSGVVVRCAPLSPRVDHYEIAVFLQNVAEEDLARLDDYVSSRA